ncbi:MAG: acyl--CoA ligase [Oscillospiraceae bacterium]|jgi:acyl-CoA synthetase (AMP-forming)/AMP-acid ligase II|nr:acyl--CoA ligase [Oscillospiraceae bacterium]
MGMLVDYLVAKLIWNSHSCITEGGTTITYAEFLDKAECLASKLSDKHVYGVLCAQELNTAIGIFACLLSGATAVPLSYRYGQAHADSIIECSNLQCLITDDGGNADVMLLCPRPCAKRKALADIALIPYSSDLSDNLKGVMLTEESLYYNLVDIENQFYMEEEDSILIIRPLYHCSVFTGEFLAAMSAGAHIHFYSKPFFPQVIAKEVFDKSITVLGATPSVHGQLCDFFAKFSRKVPLKKVVSSGESMTKAVADKMLRLLPATKIYSSYGLTEASPRVALLNPDLFEKHYKSVGAPLAHVEVMVTDEIGNALPANADGELLVRGEGMMSGFYLNAQETEHAAANSWYHTGKIGCLDKKGLLYVKKRSENMIVRAGRRILPHELESVLTSHAKVADAAVYEASDKRSLRKITADVVSEPSVSKKDILNLCREGLPSYAVPDVVNFVDYIPRNGAGKVIQRCGDS